mmetsp:Transcript_11786/g.32660  ORF Transcript_11786/g.32660 Transcript_11786/m.32660 type:complete len:91 (-) Transcript_11786:336-608(-)
MSVGPLVFRPALDNAVYQRILVFVSRVIEAFVRNVIYCGVGIPSPIDAHSLGTKSGETFIWANDKKGHQYPKQELPRVVPLVSSPGRNGQ